MKFLQRSTKIYIKRLMQYILMGELLLGFLNISLLIYLISLNFQSKKITNKPSAFEGTLLEIKAAVLR